MKGTSMNRRIAVLVTATASMLALSGCIGGGGGDDETVIVPVIVGWTVQW